MKGKKPKLTRIDDYDFVLNCPRNDETAGTDEHWPEGYAWPTYDHCRECKHSEYDFNGCIYPDTVSSVKGA